MNSFSIKDRFEDALSICKKNGRAQFIGFLNDAEKSSAVEFCKYRSDCALFGGYEDADRVFFGAFPEYAEPQSAYYPIKAVTFNYRPQDKLTHRDFLGAVLSLGITRETVGDILVESGRAVMFLSIPAAKLVLSEMGKVGSVGVTVSEGFLGELPSKGELVEQSLTVASERLDCIVAAVCGTSRNTAEEMLENSLVSLNSVITRKGTAKVSEGDKITVRGYGKFYIKSIGGTTKKGRLKIITQKYI